MSIVAIPTEISAPAERYVVSTGVPEDICHYSKAGKYVDISGGTNLTPPLARFVTSPIRDVQVIVDFTIKLR